MPWECSSCKLEVVDSQLECPTCAAPKSAWSLHDGLTRNFVISARKVNLLCGNWHETFPADDSVYSETALWEKGFVSAVRKHDAEVVIDRGHQAPSHEILYVRAKAGGKAEVSVDVSVEFELEAEPGEHTFTVPVPPDLPPEGFVDVPLLLVFGPGELPEGAFPGIHVIDVSEVGEDDEVTFAPALRVSAMGKKASELEVRDAGALELGELWFQCFDAETGEPVADADLTYWPADPEEDEAIPQSEGAPSGDAPQGGGAGETGEEAAPSRYFQELVELEGNLQEGARGQAVWELQLALSLLGQELARDRIFGPETKAALTTFQSAEGEVADGIAGPQTAALLDRKLGSDEPDPLDQRSDWHDGGTDEAGIYRRSLVPFDFVTVDVAGYQACNVPVLEELGEAPLALALSPDLGCVKVLALDEEEEPISGARYTLTSAEEGGASRAGVLSDEGFVCETELPVGYYRLVIEGYAPASVPTLESPFQHAHLVIAEEGDVGVIAVQVFNEYGEPLAALPYRIDSGHEGTTDSEGRLSHTDVLHDYYVLELEGHHPTGIPTLASVDEPHQLVAKA